MPDFMTLPRLLTPVFALTLAIGLNAGAGIAQEGEMPPPTVTVVTVHTSDVHLTSTLPGRVVASAEAEVRPQVSGIITERLYSEGAHVNEGEVLYKIDPASYEAAVAQARAAVAQAGAQVTATKREADRLETLSERNIVSEQALDSAIAARDGAVASVQAAEAQLQLALIELDRTDIRARLSGEIGLSTVSPGALVTASQASPLATVRNIDPVYVDVTQSAADLLNFRRGHDSIEPGEGMQDVRLTLADGSEFSEVGTLTAAEPVVDMLTGVVVLRITFANPDRLLLPGMFVQAEMPAGIAQGAILVPQEGVSRNRRGQPTALVVNKDDIVEQRVLGILQDSGHFWVVDRGLEDGERIIVEGLQNAVPGSKVAPQEREPRSIDNTKAEPDGSVAVPAPEDTDAPEPAPAESTETPSE